VCGGRLCNDDVSEGGALRADGTVWSPDTVDKVAVCIDGSKLEAPDPREDCLLPSPPPLKAEVSSTSGSVLFLQVSPGNCGLAGSAYQPLTCRLGLTVVIDAVLAGPVCERNDRIRGMCTDSQESDGSVDGA
jgi:hypothetical protein